jgi:hypothetical protein
LKRNLHMLSKMAKQSKIGWKIKILLFISCFIFSFLDFFFFIIFNAEAEAINIVISITRNIVQPKRVILSDSLSCLTSLGGMSKIYRPKVVRLMNQIHRKKEHLILMWVPGHARVWFLHAECHFHTLECHDTSVTSARKSVI